MTSIVVNPLSNNITTTDYSLLVGTTAVTVFPNGLLLGRNLQFMRIWNVSTGATIWLSRASGVVASANGAGSFPLLAGTYELWTSPQAIPVNSLSIVATAAGTPVTIEVG